MEISPVSLTRISKPFITSRESQLGGISRDTIANSWAEGQVLNLDIPSVAMDPG